MQKRAAIYSGRSKPEPKAAPAPAATPVPRVPWRQRHPRFLKVSGISLLAILAVLAAWMLLPPAGMTEAQVQALVQRALGEKRDAPPPVAEAYDAVLPSVVYVRGSP